MWIHAMGEYGPGGLHDVAKIRVYNPLSLLAKDMGYHLTTDSDWKQYSKCDMFWVERYWKYDMSIAETKEFIDFVKKNQKKLIYEIDDNLLDLAAINIQQKARIRMLASAADVLVVSTEELGSRMSCFNSNIMIIPNYLSIQNIGTEPKERKKNQKVTIGYMGTFSHQADFQMIKLPLLQLLNKYQDRVRLELIGAVSSLGCLAQLPNVTVHNLTGRSDYSSFWSWLNREISWDIGLAPLKLDGFTRCKSDIKFLDYAAMGCCGVFSQHPSYSNTVVHNENGLLCENTVDDWYAKLEQLILDPELQEELREKAVAQLYGSRLLEKNLSKWNDAIVMASTRSESAQLLSV